MNLPHEFKAPTRGWEAIEMPKIFVAGSIEGGKALPWQIEVRNALEGYPVVLLNPRRDEWMTTLEQRMDEPIFREQVEWELNGLDKADHIFMYFDPDTYSPVTLIEFGRHVHSDKLMIGCPPGFWRRGNLEVTCAWHGRVLHDSFEALMAAFKAKLDLAGSQPMACAA